MNDFNVTEASQVVVSPDENVSEELEMRLEELVDGLPPIPFRDRVILTLGRWVHPLGIHSYVRHKRYEPVSDRLVDVGRVCMFCSRGLSS